MLYVDSREKKPVQAVVGAVVPTTVIKLNSADFALYDKDNHCLGLERKEVHDLLASLTTRLSNGVIRLNDQIARMKVDYTHYGLIVEGHLGYNSITRMIELYDGLGQLTPTEWNHGSLQMIMWNFTYRDKVMIFTTDDKYATADLLRILHQRSEKGCVLPR